MADQKDALRIVMDRADAVYQREDEVIFHIEAGRDGPTLPERITYSLTWDRWRVIEEGIIHSASLPHDVVVTPAQAGFLRLSVGPPGAPDDKKLQAAAAVSPRAIPPSMPVPDDFGEYWLGQVAEHLSNPVEAKVEHCTSHRVGVVYKVKVQMPGERNIHGWLLKPRGEGPFPALVRFHGAGVYPVPPDNGLDWTTRGMMVFSVNPHPIPNDRPPEFYEALRTGELADYRTRGRANRDTIYFREMFLRAVRAVDFLGQERDWDGKSMVLEGHSQGGAQALAAAALNDNVSCIVVSCSTHCDHTGPAMGRVPGWPRIVEIRDGISDPVQLEAARYIDGVNFASMIVCPAMFSLGFLDDLCPPTGIYAAYNSLRGPKMIRHEVEVGHVHTEACKAATYEWVSRRIEGRR